MRSLALGARSSRPCGGRPAPPTLPARDTDRGTRATISPTAKPDAPADADDQPARRIRASSISTSSASPRSDDGAGAIPRWSTSRPPISSSRRTRRPRPARPQQAISLYRRIVSDFPESQYAPVCAVQHRRHLRRPRRSAADDRHAARAGEGLSRTRASRSTATSTSPRCRPTTSSSPTRTRRSTRCSRATNLTFADRVEAFARKGYVADRAQAVRRGRRGARSSRGRRVAGGPAHRRPVLHRDGQLLPRRARAPEVPRGAGAAARRPGWSPTSSRSACSRSRPTTTGRKPRLQAGVLGDRLRLPDVADLRRAVAGDRHRRRTRKRIDAATRPQYIVDVHDRVREHLEKALEGHRMNVELAKAYGVDTPWSRGSESRRRRGSWSCSPRRRDGRLRHSRACRSHPRHHLNDACAPGRGCGA